MQKLKRRSLRLRQYDYASPGWYFVTACTAGRNPFFGNICDGKMRLSRIGYIAEHIWRQIPIHYPHVALDAFIVMPDHVHGIINIKHRVDVGHVGTVGIVGAVGHVGAENFLPLLPQTLPLHETPKQPSTHRFQYVTPFSLSSIIRGYKIGVTKMCRIGGHDFAWQRNFYEHVVRDDGSLNRIRQYIRDNPTKWEIDPHDQ